MIVDILYKIAKQHLKIRSFIYDSVNETGNGSEAYPLFWLEDPILLNSTTPNMLNLDFNFSITEIPINNSQVNDIQDRCFRSGLAVIEKLKRLKQQTGFSVLSFSGLSLRRYYDNNAAGYRFSVSLSCINPQNLCTLDEEFDPNKEFYAADELPDFTTENKSGCAIFSDKPQLPEFDIS